eukprot:scaffold37384_cov14-Tisochrysis_lutea.AAC.1
MHGSSSRSSCNRILARNITSWASCMAASHRSLNSPSSASPAQTNGLPNAGRVNHQSRSGGLLSRLCQHVLAATGSCAQERAKMKRGRSFVMSCHC